MFWPPFGLISLSMKLGDNNNFIGMSWWPRNFTHEWAICANLIHEGEIKLPLSQLQLTERSEWEQERRGLERGGPLKPMKKLWSFAEFIEDRKHCGQPGKGRLQLLWAVSTGPAQGKETFKKREGSDKLKRRSPNSNEWKVKWGERGKEQWKVGKQRTKKQITKFL